MLFVCCMDNALILSQMQCIVGAVYVGYAG